MDLDPVLANLPKIDKRFVVMDLDPQSLLIYPQVRMSYN